MEFLLAAVPVLLIALSSIEAIHWYFARQAVSLALIQAARAGITQHADPTIIDSAFSQALLPLYAGPTPDATRARLQRAMKQRESNTGLPAWRIRILSPSSASFNDFGSHNPDLPQTGKLAIDNDYLHEQHQRQLTQGRPAGRKPFSGQSPLEANTLILHLTWLHQPLLPGMKQLLRQIAPRDHRYSSRAMAKAGYLPLQRQVALVMQSHPVAWDMPKHGRITRAIHANAPEEENDRDTTHLSDPGHTQGHPSGQHDSPPCAGLWCLRDYEAGEPQDRDGNEGVRIPDEAGEHAESGSGEQHEGNYLDAELVDEREVSTPPDVTDDCPGCCD